MGFLLELIFSVFLYWLGEKILLLFFREKFWERNAYLRFIPALVGGVLFLIGVFFVASLLFAFLLIKE